MKLVKYLFLIIFVICCDVGIKLENDNGPTKIKLETDVLFIKTDGSNVATIKAHLFYDDARAGAGHEIKFSASQNNIRVGRFSDLGKSETNENGIATVKFYADSANIDTNDVINIIAKFDTTTGIYDLRPVAP
ncbi:MAG: hypothetical protein D8M58_11865 [Calditrichaeota bacterium]|nr:MAG: hypothetical protein DWQ03_12650 [Calditrichota bacterium]MBL1206092.1 hypothetical protein [Calditrichota bacterium]